MTNKIQIVFDNSDLKLQENLLDPKNLKIIFGYEDPDLKEYIKCSPRWNYVEGDKVDLACSSGWVDVPGDDVSLYIDCTSGNCDNTPKETNDFSCECSTTWVPGITDFNINCSGGSSTNDGVLGTFTAGSGENATFTINGLEIFTARSGETVEPNLSIYQTFIAFDVTEGQNVNVGLHNTRFISSSSYMAEVVNVNIAYATVASFAVNVNEGQSIEPDVTVGYYAISTDNPDGQYSTVNLSTYPSATLEAVGYNGDNLSVSTLLTSKVIDTNSYVGENFTWEIDLPDTGKMNFTVDDGQELFAELGVESVFEVTAGLGNTVEAELSTISLLDVSYIQGEVVGGEFYKSQTFDIKANVYHGENTSYTVNTTTGFIIDSLVGEVLSGDVVYDPYMGYPTEANSGEIVVFQLTKLIVMDEMNQYGGESVEAELATYPSFRMNFDFYTGESSTASPMYTVQLGTFVARMGENVNIPLDETPNVEMPTGENLAAELATDTFMSFKMYSGESVESPFKRAESIPISFTAHTGEYSETEVKLIISTAFRIDIKWSSSFVVDQWSNSPSHIDLDKRRCCCTDIDDITNIEMDDAPYNSTMYDHFASVCETMTFELSTRRVMSFNFADGQHMAYDDKYNTLDVRVYEGQTVYSKDVVTEHTIDLESGNLMPGGDDVVIDVARPEIPSDVKPAVMYSGDEVNFILGASYSVGFKSYEGCYVSMPIVTDPAPKPLMYAGENVRFEMSTTRAISMSCYGGENIKPTIYEPPYLYYGGEIMEVILEAKNDYYAEFAIDGCLVNDYRETDPESGQPLPQLHGGANVEGEEFSKFIEGRCY